MKQYLKPSLLLLGIILLCTLIARWMTSGESLDDYAKANPELAYATPQPSVVDGKDETSFEESSSEEPDTVDARSDETASEEEPSDEEPSDEPASEESGSEESGSVEAAPNPERITLDEDFYYEPLSDEIIARITGISYPDYDQHDITYDDLRYLNILYNDFDGNTQTGALICNTYIAQDLVEIFYELYCSDYRIDKIKLIDEYDGDDTASITDDNTSCFNYRPVEGTSHLSQHALGLAIDINPFYNPYVTYPDGNVRISPVGSEPYANRDWDFPYKIDTNDLCYQLFTQHGFTWGGNWNSLKDYQHFQKKK